MHSKCPSRAASASAEPRSAPARSAPARSAPARSAPARSAPARSARSPSPRTPTRTLPPGEGRRVSNGGTAHKLQWRRRQPRAHTERRRCTRPRVPIAQRTPTHAAECAGQLPGNWTRARRPAPGAWRPAPGARQLPPRPSARAATPVRTPRATPARVAVRARRTPPTHAAARAPGARAATGAARFSPIKADARRLESSESTVSFFTAAGQPDRSPVNPDG